MKIPFGRLLLLFATRVSPAFPYLGPSEGGNLTVSSDCEDLTVFDHDQAHDCEAIAVSIDNLKDKLEASTCTLSASESGPNDRKLGSHSSNDWLYRLYDKYYGTCQFICGCPGDRLSIINHDLAKDPSATKEQDETVQAPGIENDFDETMKKMLVPNGDCDASLKALDAIDVDELELSLSSACVSTTDSYLYNYFCENDEGDGSESICAGFYDYCNRPPPCPGFCIANLGNHTRQLEFTNSLSKKAVHNKMKKKGANPNGIIKKRIDGLSVEGCKKAVEFINSKVDSDFVAVTHSDRDSLKLTGEELINVLGEDEVKKLVNFFHDSLGYKAPITAIRFQRHTNNKLGFFKGHIDNMNTLITFLKQNYDNEELKGGGMYHFTDDGLLTNEKITTGLTIVHGPDVLHTVYPWIGSRDILDISSDPDGVDAKCMLAHLLND